MLIFRNILARIKPTPSRYFVMRLSFLTISIMAATITTSTLASENIKPSLSLEAAIAQSLKQHPELASFSHRIQSADGKTKQAAVRQKPVVTLMIEDAFGTGENKGFTNAQSTLSISWILDGRLSNQRVAKFHSKSSLLDIEREIKRYDIAANTAHNFLIVMAFQERLSIALTARKHASGMLNDIVNRVKAGKASIADQLLAEVNFERSELQVEDIEHELRSAKRVLVSMWGDNKVSFSQASGSLQATHKPIQYEELQKSISNNVKVRHFLTQERIVESEIALAKEDAKNRLGFNAGISRYERGQDYGFRFGISLPLGKPGRNEGLISSLGADKNRLRADSHAMVIQLTTRLFVLYENLKHSHHVSKSLENTIIPRLEQALKEAQKGYRLGKNSFQEWSVIQQEVLDSHLSLLDARLSIHSKTIELERLTGLQLMPPKKYK